MRDTRQHGFTLIEILVVVGIIGFLATIAVVTFSNIQKSARDTRRFADAEQLVKAIKLYREQNGGFPPVEVDGDCSGWDSTMTDANSDGNYFIDELVNAGIMGKAPRDPSESGPCIGVASLHYHYARYNAGSYGCDPARGRMFVFGMNTERSVAPALDPSSPGWSCPTREWENGANRWVTGGFEN